jgi:hypothetical protein
LHVAPRARAGGARRRAGLRVGLGGARTLGAWSRLLAVVVAAEKSIEQSHRAPPP